MNIDFHAHLYPEDYFKKLEASTGDVRIETADKGEKWIFSMVKVLITSGRRQLRNFEPGRLFVSVIRLVLSRASRNILRRQTLGVRVTRDAVTLLAVDQRLGVADAD